VNTSHAEGIHAAVVASRPELLPWMPWAREPSLPGALAAAERGIERAENVDPVTNVILRGVIEANEHERFVFRFGVG